MCHPNKSSPRQPVVTRRDPAPKKTAEQLGLPTGDAVMRNGKITILPKEHDMDEERGPEIGPAQMPTFKPSSTTQTVIKTSAIDRAKGFNISTSRLSWAFALAGSLIAIWGYSAPVFSVTTLLFAFTAYATAWVIAWLSYQFVSPDGATILHAFLAYRLVRHHQKDRKGVRNA